MIMELLKIFGGFIGFMFVCVSVVVVVSWVMLMAVNDVGVDINTEFDETDNDFDSRDLL
jgi:hypothetical protein